MRFLVAALACFAICLSGAAFGQEKGKGKAGADASKRMVTTFLKQLEPAQLTAEQKTKVEEIFSKAAKSSLEKRTEAGITAEVFNKRTKVAKEVRESGKKGDEAKKAIAEKLGLTEEQAKALTAADQIVSKAKLEIGKLLSEEQLAKLEDQVKTSVTPKTKGKKKAAA